MFTNLTPHAISIQLDSGKIITVPPSGKVARVSYQANAPIIATVDVDGEVVAIYGNWSGAPRFEIPPFEGIGIVSRMMLDAVQHALDFALWEGPVPALVAPDTGPTAVRNEQGQVATVRNLIGLMPDSGEALYG